jgi:signal transduction histidine kinase
VILVDASRGVPKAGVCTEPLARDYATLPFGLLKRPIWPQMNDQLPLLHVSSVYLPVESNAVNREVRFPLAKTQIPTPELQQVMINLMMNGMEAKQSVSDRPRELVVRSGQGGPGKALISVADCGVGIAAENVDRLFNPFFTTKSIGMGMGLSICRLSSMPTGAGCGRPRAGRGVLSFTLRSPMTKPPSVIDVACWHF